MEAVLDKFGRIVIPKSIRIDIGLKPGSVLEVEEKDKCIVLKPQENLGVIEIRENVSVYKCKADTDITDFIKEQRKERDKKITGFNNG